jgi:hypothetical protein
MRSVSRPSLVAALLGGAALIASPAAIAGVSGAAIAGIATANVGKHACSANSAGGTAFDSSCTGNGGQP